MQLDNATGFLVKWGATFLVDIVLSRHREERESVVFTLLAFCICYVYRHICLCIRFCFDISGKPSHSFFGHLYSFSFSTGLHLIAAS